MSSSASRPGCAPICLYASGRPCSPFCPLNWQANFGIGDHTRIAAQIIPGIGFIGAGSILHDKGGVSGITTAATIFVVASIGMAAGGGLYLVAIFSTMLIYLALHLLGILERQLNLKPLTMTYIVTAEKTADELVSESKFDS